ncbi:MAG: hypothetical protein IEMM0003_0945 [bacterium]|nr:MAG: hypothetical protein IEMM0003_0945 [bacterium]
MRFVGYIAKCYKHKPFEEIVSDGILGLIIAAGKYDVSRNVKFVSYAIWWICNIICPDSRRYFAGLSGILSEQLLQFVLRQR